MKQDVILGKINISSLLLAQKTFKDALKESATPLNRDGCIQRFEYCFELAWKTLKRILKEYGIDANSPRATFREAAKEKLIDDPEIWFVFLEYRNNTVHTYNAQTADEIFAVLPTFDQKLDQLTKIVTQL